MNNKFPEVLEKLLIPNITLRDCFDVYSYEFKETTVEQKINTLQKILSEYQLLNVVIHEYKEYYENIGKGAILKDLHQALKRLINYHFQNITDYRFKDFDIVEEADLINILSDLLKNPNDFGIGIKNILYKYLVQKRKAYQFPTDDLLNPSQLSISNDSHLNAWAYWCGNLMANTVLIGQDFGNVAYYINFDGKDDPLNATNTNLQMLFKQAGIELNNVDEDNSHLPLYFTNAVLGAKNTQGMSGGLKKSWYKKSSHIFIKELLQIIQPKYIIVMGKIAYETVAEIFDLKVEKLENAVQANPHIIAPNTYLYVMFHPSALGQISRPFKQQLADWASIQLY